MRAQWEKQAVTKRVRVVTEPSLRDRAKQGEIDAIAALMNRAVQSQGMQITLAKRSRCLQVVLESMHPSEPSIGQRLKRGLQRLTPEGIEAVKISGRCLKTGRLLWTETFAIGEANSPAPKESATTVLAQPQTVIQESPVVAGQVEDTATLSSPEARDRAITEAFQRALGSEAKISINRSKKQLAIILQFPQEIALAEADLLAILETVNLADEAALQGQSLRTLKIFQQPAQSTKQPLQPLLTLRARPAAKSKKPPSRSHAGQTLLIQTASFLVSALMMLSLLVFPLIQQHVMPRSNLAATDYCPPSAQTITSAPPETAPAQLETYYAPIAITGPVFRQATGGHSCVRFNLYINRDFNPKQHRAIVRATRLMALQVMQNKTLDCAYDYANRDYEAPSPDEDKALLRQAFWQSLVYVDEQASLVADTVTLPQGGDLYIDGFDISESMAHGLALLDLYPKERIFWIYLNRDFIESRLSLLVPSSPEIWAGIIAHEMMHNLGWDHPNGYEGSLITEFGNCISHEGTHHRRQRLHPVAALLNLAIAGVMAWLATFLLLTLGLQYRLRLRR